MRVGVAIGIAIACCGWARSARADVARIGVVPTVLVNVSGAQAESMADALGKALGETFRVDVVSGREVSRRVPADRPLEQCFADAECIADIGGRLDVDQLLFLVVVRVGDSVQIDPVWVEVVSSRNVSRASIVLEDGADPVAVFTAAASSLLPDAEPRPVGEPAPDAGAPVPLGGGDERAGRRLTKGVWIAGGVSIVALGVGIAAGVSALSLEGELQDEGCDVIDCANEQERADSLRRRAIAADVLYGVSAVAAITAAILYYRSGGDDTSAISVIPARSGLSVTVGLEF